MPSHYEPCGMNQIYSLRYGTVPIVRAVGGLDDTVEQFDPQTRKGTGFKFKPYTGEALLDTLQTALKLYRQPRCLAVADAQRHDAGLLLAELRPRVREGLRAGEAGLRSRERGETPSDFGTEPLSLRLFVFNDLDIIFIANH